jgi:ATP adenylyltransferase
MDHLWAPWRMEYIDHSLKNDPHEGCIFCTCLQDSRDEEHLILHRGNHTFIIMNLFPYNNGHLMVVPHRHIAEITELNDTELLEIGHLLSLSVKALTKAIHPDGFNIGMNLGRVAGAGIADHLHYHVVPRWNGDTNFMPVLGETKVISQGLRESYHTLKAAFDKILGTSK